jgi:hypothetical protein
MEESGSFAVEMTIDVEMPEPLTSTQSAINGRIDLSSGRSTFEARSSNQDAWTELVVDGVAYQSRGEIVNAPRLVRRSTLEPRRQRPDPSRTSPRRLSHPLSAPEASRCGPTYGHHQVSSRCRSTNL